MAKEQQPVQATMVGGSSLLVIFAVLCLMVFALLGFSTVQADKRLADISVQAVEKFYAADTRAEEILAQLRGGSIPEGVEAGDGVYTYYCPVSDRQVLQAVVRADDYAVLSWKQIPTTEWNERESLTVWDGES